MKKAPSFVLASGSPRRKQILDMLGIACDVVVTNADETLDPLWSPSQAVENLSLRKVQAAAPHARPHHTIFLAADTVVVEGGDILGKPRDAVEAHRMLERLCGRTHEVMTGLAIWNPQRDDIVVTSVCTNVTLRQRDREWIDWYVSTGEPMDKAGAYAIQGLGSLLVQRIEGDYYNVVGLPVGELDKQLQSFGYSLRTWM